MTCFGHNPYARGPRLRWDRLAVWIVYLGLLVAAGVGVAACARLAVEAAAAPAAAAAQRAVPPAPAPTSTKDADAQIKAARAHADELERQLGAARLDIGRIERARDALAREDLRRRLAWLAGILLLGIPASVALWFILPAGLKSWAVYGGLACLGFAAAAYAARAIVPWLELAGWVLLAAGAAWGLWQLWRHQQVALAAADHGDRLEQAILGLRGWFQGDEALLKGLIDDVKHDSAKAQKADGTRRLLALLRGKNPEAPTAPAIASLAQPPAASGGAA